MVISYADDDQEPQTPKHVSTASAQVVQGGWHAAANRWLLSGMQRYLNVPLEHVTARHDDTVFLVAILLHPLWYTAPLLNIVWGQFGGWLPLFWAPSLVYTVLVQILCFASMYCAPEQYLTSRVGGCLILAMIPAYSLVVMAPLVLHPICGDCIPLGHLLGNGSHRPSLGINITVSGTSAKPAELLLKRMETFF
jgi:hypothetical protein